MSTGGAYCSPYGCGTVFKITASGTLTTLHSFDGTDGSYPFAALVQSNDGSLYGTTSGGGTSSLGTVFKITPSGTLTTLHSFDSTDGASPQARLIQATDGNFYGTTSAGGASTCSGGCGTVFKITPSGALTTLHSFDGTDGNYPYAGLIQATDGDLYSTTANGGSTGCLGGCGTVFKITLTGRLTTLHSFDNTDGACPNAELIQATDGSFYGTTFNGGDSTRCEQGCGTVFKITPSGALTTLHSFDGADGSGPYAWLIQATDGNFYGTTGLGGANIYYGTVFKITPSATLTTLHSFDYKDGETPIAGLIQATGGNFYGTTAFAGGRDLCFGGCGTVFGLSVGLGPFVAPQPMFGSVGTVVRILGTKLTAASSVTFNGTPAPFEVVSPGFIKTVVPPGATTGPIEVTTPAGTLASNPSFTVVP
jgi:uncharacterized repeat protein (TIGR03803 family)